MICKIVKRIVNSFFFKFWFFMLIVCNLFFWKKIIKKKVLILLNYSDSFILNINKSYYKVLNRLSNIYRDIRYVKICYE